MCMLAVDLQADTDAAASPAPIAGDANSGVSSDISPDADEVSSLHFGLRSSAFNLLQGAEINSLLSVCQFNRS